VNVRSTCGEILAQIAWNIRKKRKTC